MSITRRAKVLNKKTALRDGFSFGDYEEIVFVDEKKSGLRAVIAIHNTWRGPAAGATRYAPYKNDGDALEDAMRLARGMTAKCALAGLPFGGGKGAIMASSRKTPALLRSYAEVVSRLGGRFITGEDYGMTTADVREMRGITPYVVGTSKYANPAYWTARGMFAALKSAAKAVWGSDNLAGRTIGISGLGKVGLEFAKQVHAAGGVIWAEEIDAVAARQALKKIPSIFLAKPGRLSQRKLDVYSPCARGGILNKKTIPRLRAEIICGGANNQLWEAEDGVRLHRAGILYLPDYAINAGGVISVTAELRPDGWGRAWVEKKVDNIGQTVSMLLRKAGTRMAMSDAADRQVCEILGGKVGIGNCRNKS